MNKRIILSHAGKQHSYQVAKALDNIDYLSKFYTSSYIRSKMLQNYLLKTKNQYWTRRFIKGVGGRKVISNWRFEVKEILLRKLLGKTPFAQQAIYERDMKFDKYVSFRLPLNKAPIFWGFQGSCYKSLQKAKRLGKLTICELTTAHVTEAKKILGEEMRLNPEWADSFDNLVFPPEYEKRLQAEPHVADKVIAASSFTKQSLINDGVPPQKIVLLPLGFELGHIPEPTEKEIYRKTSARRLKLLYAGTVTQRKGMKYLLDAFKYLKKNDIELNIVGSIQGSGEEFRKYENKYIYHSPVSQQRLYDMYREYDALVLPTIFEGFGLVIVEALASGLPVITTRHSFGAEIIKDDHNGYLVPIRDTAAIIEATYKLRSKTDEEFAQMRKNARLSVLDYSWRAYTKRLKTLLEKGLVPELDLCCT